MIIKIKEVSKALDKNGSEYRKIKGTMPDGKETTKSIFSNLEDSWGLLEEGAVLDLTLEKKGQFWNVAEIKPVEQQPTKSQGVPHHSEKVREMVPREEKMSRDDWIEKDRITRKSIERQTSLNASIEVAKLIGADKTTPEKIIATARVFEAYLERKEVQPAKSRLAEEALKLGAKEDSAS